MPFPSKSRIGNAAIRASVVAWTVAACAGCGLDVSPGSSLFFLPIEVDGQNVGSGIVDTGGAYELMLNEPFGLRVTGSAEVLVFSGPATVGITEPFRAIVDGAAFEIDNAIVGLDLCECNGVGFLLLRKSQRLLNLDFPSQRAWLSPTEEGRPSLSEFPFLPPPAGFSTFDTAFIEVTVTGTEGSRSLLGLLDTGTTTTLMRRGIVTGAGNSIDANAQTVRIGADGLGTVQAQVRLIETEGLPDLIIGVDVMRAWSDEWAFRYDAVGGAVFAAPRADATASVSAAASVR